MTFIYHSKSEIINRSLYKWIKQENNGEIPIVLIQNLFDFGPVELNISIMRNTLQNDFLNNH